jgi:hypothetical protein
VSCLHCQAVRSESLFFPTTDQRGQQLVSNIGIGTALVATRWAALNYQSPLLLNLTHVVIACCVSGTGRCVVVVDFVRSFGLQSVSYCHARWVVAICGLVVCQAGMMLTCSALSGITTAPRSVVTGVKTTATRTSLDSHAGLLMSLTADGGWTAMRYGGLRPARLGAKIAAVPTAAALPTDCTVALTVRRWTD